LATSSSPKKSRATEPVVGPEDRLLNRELSWLDFNARVLDLALDPGMPLLERAKFCSIFSANLDEFFMVRVAGLMGQAATGMAPRSPDGRTPPVVLTEIRERVLEMTQRQSRAWLRDLQPALAAEGIVVGQVEDCIEDELAELSARFDSEIFPVLTPLAVGPGQPFPYISGLSLSLGLFVRDPESGEERFARVKVPERLPRFIGVGTRGLLIPLETVIAHYLPWLFPGMEISERAFFRVTRDADFEVDDEADDLLEAVEVELRRRRFGHVVRVEVSSSISSAMLERLAEGLAVAASQIYPIRGMLDLADVMQVAGLDRPELKDEAWLSLTPPRLEGMAARSMFAEVRKQAILVQHPYDSFATSVESFVRAAVDDPDVIAMKTTVYRTSDDSPTIPALIDCAEQGKQSVCLVELKARFDEHRNIEWARAMEQAGVHVVYGFPNLKIHGKITLIVRREGDTLRRYVHVGTGNYHARTARLYEDVGLFTADEGIAADVADLFNFLTGFGRPQQFRKILVAPFGLRQGLVEEIRKVAAAAAAGKHARIRIKVNALVDPESIEELYRASQKGAKVEIVARGICALRPGVKGMSENITVRSVVGRFLEHSRLFVFEAGDETSMYLGSADLMPRNLDHRVEVVAPVEDSRARQELSTVFDTLLADNVQAWELQSDGSWERLSPKKSERAAGAQAALMRRARLRARRRTTARRGR
jgi:polyphosphate kinase